MICFKLFIDIGVFAMIIEQVIGNLNSIDRTGKHLEHVYLESTALRKRVQRVETDCGKVIGIRLKHKKDLVEGDILYMDDKIIIAIQAKEETLLKIKPTTMGQMAEISHSFGERHLPILIEGNEMYVQYDYLIEKMLIEKDISYQKVEKKFKKTLRNLSHSHI